MSSVACGMLELLPLENFHFIYSSTISYLFRVGILKHVENRTKGKMNRLLLHPFLTPFTWKTHLNAKWGGCKKDKVSWGEWCWERVRGKLAKVIVLILASECCWCKIAIQLCRYPYLLCKSCFLTGMAGQPLAYSCHCTDSKVLSSKSVQPAD